jgi:tRNA(adenine34) deaminase
MASSYLSAILTPEFSEILMQQALIEARAGYAAGETPVGAVVWCNGSIVGRGRNYVESQKAVTRHAEIVAIENAGTTIETWRLHEAVLCVTVEPCLMCMGAIRHSGILIVIFGASQSNYGCLGSVLDLRSEKMRVIQGIAEKECRELMTLFFQDRREKSSFYSCFNLRGGKE